MEGFGRPGGPELDTKIEEIRGKFVTSFGSLPGEGSGRVLDGFGEDFGRVLESQDASRGGFGEDLGRILGGFCKDLEGFREDFNCNVGRFLIEISKDF